MGSVSSPFPQQTHRTPPLRHKINQSETRPPSSVFPWERDATRSTPRGKPASTLTSSSFTYSDVVTDTGARDDGIEEALRKEIDGKGLHHSERLLMKLMNVKKAQKYYILLYFKSFCVQNDVHHCSCFSEWLRKQSIIKIGVMIKLSTMPRIWKVLIIFWGRYVEEK